MTSIEAIIDRQIRRWELERTILEEQAQCQPVAVPLQPVITVSRQRGSGGTVIAGKLAERFHYTYLHRDIIDRMCESSGIKRRLIESLDEHARSQMDLWFDSVISGKYIDAGDYTRQLLQVIYSISRLGGVVAVGRGANFIVGPERGFHIRVIAPRDKRVRRLMEFEKLSEKEAWREIEHADHERADFIRKVFKRDIDDPLGYDLVVNFTTISLDAAVSLLAAAAMEKFQALRQ